MVLISNKILWIQTRIPECNIKRIVVRMRLLSSLTGVMNTRRPPARLWVLLFVVGNRQHTRSQKRPLSAFRNRRFNRLFSVNGLSHYFFRVPASRPGPGEPPKRLAWSAIFGKFLDASVRLYPEEWSDAMLNCFKCTYLDQISTGKKRGRKILLTERGTGTGWPCS